MFAGLMSRWTMPFECAASSASAIWMPRSSTASISSGLPAIRCRRRLPLQQFHGDEGSPIGFVNFVNRADVRVVQRGRGLGLALEAAESLCVVGEFVGKELQGDVATELQVFRLIDHAHSPAADLAKDAVMGNRLTDGLGGRGHWVDMLGVDERWRSTVEPGLCRATAECSPPPPACRVSPR